MKQILLSAMLLLYVGFVAGCGLLKCDKCACPNCDCATTGVCTCDDCDCDCGHK